MNKTADILKKHTMKIVLVLIVIFFSVMTKGQMFAASSFQALIAQNSYVFVLATGMLMCMLTGGNIDLSVGSFVCFVGTIGGIMMVRGGMSVPVAMLLMIGAGVIYGVVEGFLIAYINIPPWIATLAGYLAFRGWGTALIGGSSIAPMPEGFIKLFTGSVPDLFGGEGLNITCILVGVIACVLFVIFQLKSRNDKVKKGYEAESLPGVIVRCVLVCAVILLFAYKLAQAGGIPNNLMPFISQVAVGRRASLKVFGNDYPTRDGTGARDYIHVQDLVEGHLDALRVLDGKPQLLTVNLGTGGNTTVLELVKAFEKASGKHIPYEICPRRAGDKAAYWTNPELAKKLLGWTAKRGIEKMCEDTWRWQQMNPEGYPD